MYSNLIEQVTTSANRNASGSPRLPVLLSPSGGIDDDGSIASVSGRFRASLAGPEDSWMQPAPTGERAFVDCKSSSGLDLDADLANASSPLHSARLLIIDDCTLYRENLAATFVANGLAAPSGAWDLPSLVTALQGSARPHIVLLSVGTRNNVMLLRAVLRISPAARVIVLGVSEDDESEIVACAEAGVAGYHMRTESLDGLLELIRKVAAGESVCSPRVSAILLNRLSALAAQRQRPPAMELVLTARETQILHMLEMGMSNRDIADELCIALHTVKNHVHSLLGKLGVRTRAQAVASSRLSRSQGDLGPEPV